MGEAADGAVDTRGDRNAHSHTYVHLSPGPSRGSCPLTVSDLGTSPSLPPHEPTAPKKHLSPLHPSFSLSPYLLLGSS